MLRPNIGLPEAIVNVLVDPTVISSFKYKNLIHIGSIKKKTEE